MSGLRPPWLALLALAACGPGFDGLTGTEVLLLGLEQEQPEEPDCELRWTATGSAIRPLPRSCEGCEHAFEVELLFDEAASTVLEGCEAAAVDRSMGYAVGEPYEDGFTWLYIRAEGSPLWQPWPSTVDFSETRFSYTEGYEDYLYTGDAGLYPEYAGLYFTSWTEFAAELD